MKSKKRQLTAHIAVFLLIFQWAMGQQKMQVMVFSKTTGYRHQSIEAGKASLAKMAKEKGFGISFTEDAAQFTEQNLKKLLKFEINSFHTYPSIVSI